MAGKKDPYRELFDHSADAILIIDGNQFVDCNDATVRMLRCSNRDQVLKTHPSALSPPVQPDGRDSREKADEMIALAFEHGSHRFEWVHRRADGESFPVEVLLTAIRQPQREVLHVVWRDITERKQLEEQLLHAQKMEAVGRLAGGIAHDFNNLLTVILGNAELLEEHVGGLPAVAERARAIRNAGNRAAALVRQLLTFGRKQERQIQVIDLNEIVENMHDMLRRLIGEDLELQIALAGEPLPIEVDVGQIEQVILNLASNARDASPEGGVLRVETAAVELAAPANNSTAGRFARLAVLDNGAGMTTEVARHAFDPFFTTKDVGRGTGLGLSTCHSIVTQSHGSIEIESEPGRGTTIVVHLPLVATLPSSGPLPTPGAAPEPARAGERILVVEDDPSVRRMVVDALRRRGYAVVAAVDGLDGAAVYGADPSAIDLIVSDVIMPHASGPRMLAGLVEQGFRPPILFLSGYSADALAELRPTAVRFDLLPKPFTAEQLVDHVRRTLDAARRPSGD